MEENKEYAAPDVIFATPRLGLCYPYPEHKDEEEKPYLSFDFIFGYIEGRLQFIDHAFQEATSVEPKNNEKLFILEAARLELNYLREKILKEMQKFAPSNDDSK